MEVVQPNFFLVFFMMAVFLSLLAPFILYLVFLQRLLKDVHPRYRTMPPGQVWLVLIPFGTYVWSFIMYKRIADSVANEFKRRNLKLDNARPGYTLGLFISVVNVLTFVVAIAGRNFKDINYFLYVTYVLLMLINWVNLYKYKKALRASGHWSTYPDYDPRLNNSNAYVQEQYQKNYGTQQTSQSQQPSPTPNNQTEVPPAVKPWQPPTEN